MTDISAAEVARISADATVRAAQIAADASTHNAYITVTGAVLSLIGAVFAATIAYRTAKIPVEDADRIRRKQAAALLAELQTSVNATIADVQRALEDYNGDFREPVELRVLREPATLQTRRAEVAALDPDTIEAAESVRMRLDDYRRAKAPIQDRLRSAGDNRPVSLREPPDGFQQVINATQTYRDELRNLEGLISKSRNQ
jgi:hypothetical protein